LYIALSKSANLALALHAAGEAITQVRGGRSLSDALKLQQLDTDLAAAAQDLAYGTLRHLGLLDALLAQLSHKPVKPPVQALLLAALYQLRARPQTSHTTVDQAVLAVSRLEPAAKGLANAVLRRYLREAAALLARCTSPTARYSYPLWWIKRLRRAWPQHWQAVLEAGNLRPPMALRVNRRRASGEKYLEKLAQRGLAAQLIGEQTLILERPLAVALLPGFAAGEVSVQDAGAQMAAPLLDVRPGMRVLDACAAPGGKAGHLLEIADCELTALDNDPRRMSRIEDNLKRLGFAAHLICADCTSIEKWSDNRPYARILLDAPCTASGVVRRHPDIKWLRRESDIARMSVMQGRMLDALWQVLAPGGKLLYATCSVFPQENTQTIDSFLARNKQARLLSIEGLDHGQLLPDASHDGFFYALLENTG